MMQRRAGWLAWGMLLLSSVAFATDPDALLSSTDAFRIEAVRAPDNRVFVTFHIAPGYALYRDHIQISDPKGRLSFIALPHGQVVHDNYIGDREELRFQAIATVGLPQGAGTHQLLVSLQGCADLGVCFNPESRWVTIR